MNKFFRCEDNIKCILSKYAICDNMDWIQVAKFGVQWQILVNRKEIFGFIHAGEFLNWLTYHQLLNNINSGRKLLVNEHLCRSIQRFKTNSFINSFIHRHL
jgi:hypothetical protein